MAEAVDVTAKTWSITADDYACTVSARGATIEALTHRGRDLILPNRAGAGDASMAGALLAPWPNRLADGRYVFDGAVHQLPINEQATGTAVHGLATTIEFEGRMPESGRLALTGWIEPRPGYPWRIRLDVEVAVGVAGFCQRITARNESSTRAPFGMGAHPYLLAAPPRRNAVDEWSVEVSAGQVLLVSQARLLPTDLVPLGAPHAPPILPGAPTPLASMRLNHAFTALSPDRPVRLLGSAHGGVTVRMDVDAPWLQLYTGDDLGDGAARSAVAVEPMTCPPDAFNSGVDLRILEPGESTQLTWSLSCEQGGAGRDA